MNNALPPPAMLMHLVAGKFVTQALAAAAELSLAEQLVAVPRPHWRSREPWECTRPRSTASCAPLLR